MNKIALNEKVKSTNFKIEFSVNFEKFSDKDLYAYCKKVGFNARTWSRRFMATIPEVAKRRLYKKYGYCSIHEFAAKMGSVSRENTDEVLRVNEKFREMPKMKALIGEVGLSKLKVVACIATKETDSFWAEKVKNMTKQVLELYVREMRLKEQDNDTQMIESQGRIVAKFPGEARGESSKIPQGQEQISMFDSEKPISQNDNDARLENIQNHDKKSFTIQIDEETEFELWKFKQKLEKERKEPVDWNYTLKEMVKRATTKQMVRSKKITKKESNSCTRTIPLKSATASDVTLKPKAERPVSRYIPAKIRHDLQQKYHGRCAYRGCNKPAEQIHHQDRFTLKHNHENVVPLCKNHHDLIHQTSPTDQIYNKLKSEFVASSG